MEHGDYALTIRTLARAVGVNVETIRFYQRKGLLRIPQQPQGGIRRYTAQDVARVKFIKSAQRLGFCLNEVAHLLRLDEGIQCQAASELAGRHLADVRIRLEEMRRIEATLANLLEQCSDQGSGKVACPLIAALHLAATG